MPGTSLWRNSAWRVETSGRTPSRTGTGKPPRAEAAAGLGQHRLDLRDVVERLGHHQVRARGKLALQAVPLGGRVVGGGIEGGGDRERRGLADGGARLVLAAVEAGQDLDQADRVHVPDARAGGVVTDARRVTGEREDVRHPEGMRPQQLRLERHQVAVPGGDVDDALEVQRVLDAEGDRHRAHADPRHRGVGDVDGVRAGLPEQAGGVERAVDPDAARRVDLDRDHESARRRGPGRASIRGPRSVGSGGRVRGGGPGRRDDDGRRAPARDRHRRRGPGRGRRRSCGRRGRGSSHRGPRASPRCGPASCRSSRR